MSDNLVTRDFILNMFEGSADCVELTDLFILVYQMTLPSFINLVDNFDGESLHYSSVNLDLASIHHKYKWNLTHAKFQVGAFVSSWFQLPSLDLQSPSREWQFISKLCHFLVYSHQNHLTNRIKDICVIGRLWFTPNSEYVEIMQLVLELQAESIEDCYQNFYLQKLKLRLEKSILFNNFAKIYRIYNFIYHQRARIRRKYKGYRNRRLLDQPYLDSLMQESMDDDKDILVSSIYFDRTVNDIDINRERLDDAVPDYVSLNQLDIQHTEKYSSALIYKRTKSKLQHANRNQRSVICNVRILPLFAYQDMFSVVWKTFITTDTALNRNKKSAYGYILLSLLTGYPIHLLTEDLYSNNKKIIVINRQEQSYELLVNLDITKLRIKSTAIHLVIANASREMRIPLPDEIGLFFSQKSHPNDSIINEAITDIKKVLNLPYLSKARIENALYTVMVHHICSGQIASIITSKSEHHRADLWYSSHSEHTIMTNYKKSIDLLSENTDDFNTDYLSLSLVSKQQRIGSQNSPDYPLTSRFFKYLHSMVVTADSGVNQFNAYSFWMWHVCLLLTSVRAVEGAPGYLNQFNLEIGLGWISDKEERASAGSQRMVPLCEFLVNEIQSYLAYLKHHQLKYQWLMADDVNHAEFVKDILSSHRPLLNIINNKGQFDVLRPGMIRKYLHDNFRFKEDWTRHVGQRYLHENSVPEALILGVFGHETMGQETWRKQSSLSISNILSLKEVYQDMASYLHLRPVRLTQRIDA